MNLRYLGRQLALTIGLVALGASLGFTLSLALMQQAAIAQGALPSPGTPVVGTNWYDLPLYHAATTLRSAANGSGVVGAFALLGYAGYDFYRGETE